MDDIATLVPIYLLCLDEGADVIEVPADLDTTTTVGVLTGLDDPERGAILRILLQNVVLIRIIVSFDEFLEFSVTLAFFDMVS